MGKAHPHGCCQVASGDHGAPRKYPPVAGNQIGPPQCQEEKRHDVEHPTNPLLCFELIQYQKAPAARRIAVLSDAQQSRWGGASPESSKPVGGGLPAGARPMERPVLANSRHKLDRLHLSAVVDKKDELEVNQLCGQEDESQEEHEAQGVIRPEGAVLECALVLLPDKRVRPHVKHRRKRHRHRQRPNHADDGQAGPEGQPLGVETVVRYGQIARDTNAEQHKCCVETGEHAQEGDHLAGQRAVRPRRPIFDGGEDKREADGGSENV